MPSLREEQKREQGQNGVKIIVSYFCLKIQQKIRTVIFAGGKMAVPQHLS